jgi:hypothetical protein
MKQSRIVTRKELADIMSKSRGHNVTVEQVRWNEEVWGLIPARCDFNKRVFYDLEKALAALKRNALIQLDVK